MRDGLTDSCGTTLLGRMMSVIGLSGPVQHFIDLDFFCRFRCFPWPFPVSSLFADANFSVLDRCPTHGPTT